MVAKKQITKTSDCGCICQNYGFMPILLGIAMLLAVFMRYMGFSYRMIIAVFGVLLILKGIMKMTMSK